MPELPEVETVRRGLEPVMVGEIIAQVNIRRAGLRLPFPAGMAERLSGTRVRRLGRRAKYLLADLDSGETLIIHLGMSGRMLVSGDPLGRFHHAHEPLGKHDHVVLTLASGTRIVFNDARRFGMMDLCPTERVEDHPFLARLGPEPLGNRFSETHLIEAFRGRNMPVKSALLNQGIVAGLGNIYVCEVLHRTHIHPARKAGKIAATRTASLVPAIRQVLSEAIASGGSTLRDFRQADGELGYFQHAFKVYDREGAPCTTPGCKGKIRRIVQAGRSTFYCPSCQR